MDKETFNKYKNKVDLFYSKIDKFSIKCIFCTECKSYKPERFFPRYGIVNEYKSNGCLCVNCYTKKYKLTQDFFEEILYTDECNVCNKLKSRHYTYNDFNKYRNQPFLTCNSCFEKIREEKKIKRQAINSLKSQGVENIDDNTIKTKELTILIKRELKDDLIKKRNITLKGKKTYKSKRTV